jgi:LysM repeat protein
MSLVFTKRFPQAARMSFRLLLAGIFASGAVAQVAPQVELANLREDVRGLTQRVGELALRVEQLERENAELRAKSGATQKSYATVAQLKEAITDLRQSLESAVTTSKNETLERVATQMANLAKQTNAALDSLAKAPAAPRVSPPPAASAGPAESPPKDSTSYIVQKGDTLATIAKKTGAKQQDIIAANKLTDPSRILVGQTLFIPNSAAK